MTERQEWKTFGNKTWFLGRKTIEYKPEELGSISSTRGIPNDIKVAKMNALKHRIQPVSYVLFPVENSRSIIVAVLRF